MNKDLYRAQLLITETNQIVGRLADEADHGLELQASELRRAVLNCIDTADLLGRVVRNRAATCVVTQKEK